MGAKSAKPMIPSYEPYQCCPTKVTRGTKVAKVSPVASKAKLRHDKPNRNRPTLKQTPLAVTPTEPPALKSINKLSAKDSKKSLAAKEAAAKGKKGFFGSGKYYA